MHDTMAGATTKFPVGNRSPGQKPESTAAMIFGFWEDSEEYSNSSCDSSIAVTHDFLEIEDDENPIDMEENKVFWESQDQLLQATMCRTSSIETKIRKATKEALRELNSAAGNISCNCRNPASEGCRTCTQRELPALLRNAGYNCNVCKSKWLASKDIPSGEHTYLEVLHNGNPKKGEMRVVIELNLRGEFEMARASDEYNRLTNRLPEVFVGKIERLRAIVKILCAASKRCMKDRKMHIAPWRKQKYMQAKWTGGTTLELRAPEQLMLPAVVEEGLGKPSKHTASLLTFDFIKKCPPMAIKAL